MKSFLKVLAYIAIGIFAIPILALGLFLIIGLSLFVPLFLVNKIKYKYAGTNEEQRPFTIASGIILTIAALIIILVLRDSGFENVFTIQNYFILQAVVFVGLLPQVYLQTKILKKNKSQAKE